MIVSMAKDAILEAAIDELKGTLSAEQSMEMEVLELKDNMATNYIYLTIGTIISGVVLANVLFWVYNVSFWLIFITFIVTQPYIMYKSITNKVKTKYNLIKFYAGLAENVKDLSESYKHSLKSFIK